MSEELITYTAELTADNQAFCSFSAQTVEEKGVLYRAINNPTDSISNLINQEIVIRDVYIETVSITRDNGGEAQAPRVVLITKDGKSYGCVSIGIFSAVKKLISVFGMPTWEEGIKVKVVQIKRKERNILTLTI